LSQLASATHDPARKLIVVTLDELSLLDLTTTPGARSPFDQLDTTSRFFEQFYVQNVQSDADWAAAFGGQAAFRQMNQTLQEQGVTTELILCDANPDTGGEKGGATPLGFDSCRSLTQTAAFDQWPAGREASTGPALQWIHLANRMEPATESAQQPASITADSPLISQLVSFLEATSNSGISMMVTASRGRAMPSDSGPDCGVSESLIRVPCWLRGVRPQLLRDQTLLGSFSLPDMICALFSAGQDHPVTEPIPSLLIRGDDFDAVRTPAAMAVRHRGSHHRHPIQEADSVQLFLKPEDVWNVHDQAAVYPRLVEDLRRQFPNRDQIPNRDQT
jgi:hypothetical protein